MAHNYCMLSSLCNYHPDRWVHLPMAIIPKCKENNILCIMYINITYSLLGQEKNCCVALSNQPISKNKFKKLGLGMHPIFVKLSVFSPFLRKRWKNAPKFCTFGCFLKKWLEKYFPTDRPTQIFRNFTWGQHNNFLFWPYMQPLSSLSFGYKAGFKCSANLLFLILII